MAALIKTQTSSLVAALARCALPVGGRQSQRIPALGAVCLAGGSDALIRHGHQFRRHRNDPT